MYLQRLLPCSLHQTLRIASGSGALAGNMSAYRAPPPPRAGALVATAAAAGGLPRPADAAYTERLLPHRGARGGGRSGVVGRRKQRRRDNEARIGAGLPGLGGLVEGGVGSLRSQQSALRLSAAFPIPECVVGVSGQTTAPR